MKSDAKAMTSEQADALSKWCSETVESLRERYANSDRAAREWWSTEADPPEGIKATPRALEDMDDFAERLRQESYEWAGRAGELYAEEYYSEDRGIEVTVQVERFEPADDEDDPVSRDGDYRPLPAVSLQFEFNQDLIDFLKSTLTSWQNASGGRPLSKRPWAYNWSKSTRRWWVLSTYWEGFRRALLDKGVTLTGPLAHPGKDERGFFPRERKWDSKRCEWR